MGSPKRPAPPSRRGKGPGVIPMGGLYVFLAQEEPHEGIVTSMTPLGLTPLLTSARSQLGPLRTMAQEVADASGKTVKLARFERGRDVETIEPKAGPEARNPRKVMDAKALGLKIKELAGRDDALDEDGPMAMQVGVDIAVVRGPGGDRLVSLGWRGKDPRGSYLIDAVGARKLAAGLIEAAEVAENGPGVPA